MYVIPRVGKQKGKVCYFDAPMKGTAWGELLLDKASNFERKNNEFVDFSSCGKEGIKSIYFEASKQGKDKWFTFKNFDFEDRQDDDITEELVRSMPDPTDFLVMPKDSDVSRYLEDGKVPQAYIDARNNIASGDSDDYVEEEEEKPRTRRDRSETKEKEPETEDNIEENTNSDINEVDDDEEEVSDAVRRRRERRNKRGS